VGHVIGLTSAPRAETPDPVLAVRYRIREFKHGDRELRGGNPGPFSGRI